MSRAGGERLADRPARQSPVALEVADRRRDLGTGDADDRHAAASSCPRVSGSALHTVQYGASAALTAASSASAWAGSSGM